MLSFIFITNKDLQDLKQAFQYPYQLDCYSFWNSKNYENINAITEHELI